MLHNLEVGFFVGAVLYLTARGLAGYPIYDCIEFFSGAATLTHGLRVSGFTCGTFEILDDQIFEDILKGQGMLRAISLIILVCVVDAQNPFMCSRLRNLPSDVVRIRCLVGSQVRG
jgi:hypothetical protein